MPVFKDFIYTEKDGYIIIRAYCGEEINIVVPCSIKGKPVREITRHAFVAERDIQEISKIQHCLNRVRSIHLPESIIKLEGAFEDCKELTEIFLPDNAELIGDKNFCLCDKLRMIHVSQDNKRYKSQNGILYSKDGKELVCCPADCLFYDEEYLIGVEVICESAFRLCKNLKSVEIPENVQKIKSGAFSNCHNLQKVSLHPNVAMEGTGHFWCCESLKSIIFYNTKNILPRAEFYGCSNLEEIDIQSKIRVIEEYAFQGTGMLKFIVPKGVVAIKKSAFLHCHKLQVISIPRSVSRIHENAFVGCGSDLYNKKELTMVNTTFGLKPASKFLVINGSKADKYCLIRGYNIEYVEK